MQHIQKAFPLPNRFHYQWTAALLVCVGIASIHPMELQGYLLHQAGTFILLGILFWLTMKRKVSQISFALTIVFLMVHVVGAHYLYSYVPYREWLQALHLTNATDVDHGGRNMYDRLVHFGYGLLLYRLAFDVFSTWFQRSTVFRIGLIAIQFIMASSVFYELIEWVIACNMSTTDAENYNGQQGDVWDAHKDMAIATLGAMIAWCYHLFQSTQSDSTQTGNAK